MPSVALSVQFDELLLPLRCVLVGRVSSDMNHFVLGQGFVDCALFSGTRRIDLGSQRL